MRILWLGLTAIWLALIGVGLYAVNRYQIVAGQAGDPPPTWPVDSALQPVSGRNVLLQFLHPHCPCSRRNLDEVSWLLARAGGQLDVHLVFVRPPGAPEGWEQTTLWQKATALPGVHVCLDRDGQEARRFGVKTSGHTLFFDQQRRLCFSGGITGSGGHVEESGGRHAIFELMTANILPTRRFAVFGCALFSDETDGAERLKGAFPCPR
jgi:hypothetical protein